MTHVQMPPMQTLGDPTPDAHGHTSTRPSRLLADWVGWVANAFDIKAWFRAHGVSREPCGLLEFSPKPGGPQAISSEADSRCLTSAAIPLESRQTVVARSVKKQWFSRVGHDQSDLSDAEHMITGRVRCL